MPFGRFSLSPTHAVLLIHAALPLKALDSVRRKIETTKYRWVTGHPSHTAAVRPLTQNDAGLGVRRSWRCLMRVDVHLVRHQHIRRLVSMAIGVDGRQGSGLRVMMRRGGLRLCGARICKWLV